MFSFAAAIAAVLRFMLRFAGLAGVIYGVAQAVDFLLQLFFKFSIIDSITDKFNKLWEATKRFFDLREKMPDQTDAEGARLKRLNDSIEERKKKEKLDKPGARARDARTRGNGYDTTIFAVFKVRIPRLGISVTSTEQVPFRIPFTFVPTNVQ